MKEVDRLEVIREVVGKRLRQREAGERLRLCVRQVKRLVRRYRELGARGLKSGHRGRKASNAIAPQVRAEILAVVRERYEDFSPTLAQEKLTELHGYRVSVEVAFAHSGSRRYAPHPLRLGVAGDTLLGVGWEAPMAGRGLPAKPYWWMKPGGVG